MAGVCVCVCLCVMERISSAVAIVLTVWIALFDLIALCYCNACTELGLLIIGKTPVY